MDALTTHKRTVGLMFDNIAPKYDFLNHLLSFGIDKLWRKKTIDLIGKYKKRPVILDVATGTADLSIAAMKLDPLHITGIDISTNMLKAGREKVEKKGFSEKIELRECSTEDMPFDACSFDVAMVAFGIRNFADPTKGLCRIHQVLKNDGMIAILEFSKPAIFPVKQIYRFYFTHILPFIGRKISHDDTAYKYLPHSVMNFPDGEDFLYMLKNAGFNNTSQKRLTCGIATIYTGFKTISKQ